MPTTVDPDPDRPDVVTVVFRLPAAVVADTICVVGEFNDWSNRATPMRRTADGFEATVSLAIGRAYRYRFLLDGHRWENDWAADAYVPNEHGGDDSLLDLTARRVPDRFPRAADGERPSEPVSAMRPRPVRIWQ
jgi:1,4-alpha-glucan branching enzyme